jgi:hypothetical protein
VLADKAGQDNLEVENFATFQPYLSVIFPKIKKLKYICMPWLQIHSKSTFEHDKQRFNREPSGIKFKTTIQEQ